jgi:ATP/maltotriose-dependent transcriptional regulator MalT
VRQAQQPTLAPPERRIIERPRLLKQLEETDAKTILLVAPAGYGKTTLARQWARERSAAWYAANLGSADVAALARGLAHALAPSASELPAIIDEALRGMPHPAREVDGLGALFIAHLSRIAAVWLVIDDYQALAPSNPSEQLVAALAASESVRSLIASRSKPTWANARAFVYGEIVELGRQELGFDTSETAELLRDTPVSGDVVALARGWPAVLSLVTFAGRSSVPPTEAISDRLYDYLADETFNSASRTTQDTLLSLALLSSLHSEALVEAFGDDWIATAVDAARTGLIEISRHGIELHPLARLFLFERLRETPAFEERVRRAMTRAIDAAAWDEGFEFIKSFQLHDALDGLMTAAFGPLLAMGRVETLERFSRYATAVQRRTTPIVDLIDAEIAFRDGRLAEARELAVAAAERFSPSHPLKARGYNLGGTAALVRFDLLAESHRLHTLAYDFANSDQDERDALWGQCLALIYLEDQASSEATNKLAHISDATPEDRVRAATAQLLVRRQREGFRELAPILAVANRALEQTRDPRARTSFGNVCGYVLGLGGRYDEAASAVDTALADAEIHNLSFAKPHLRWTKAFVALGRRDFAEAYKELRAVEELVEQAGSDHLELNARALRARMLIVQHRAQEAVEATATSWAVVPTNAMYGEYLSTRALALAAAGEPRAARTTLSEALRLTSVVEVQTLAATAEAIRSLTTRNAGRTCQSAFDLAARLETWDALICGVRAMPKLLEILAANPHNHRLLLKTFQRSRDEALLKRVGLRSSGPYGRAGRLSRREREVIELVRQGLTNREIGRMLYISEATVKVHVRHVLEKLGARSRAEAVSLYALTTLTEGEKTLDGGASSG